MRIVYLGNFDNDWDTENYVARAFERAGNQVVRLKESDTSHTDAVDACQGADLFLFAKARFRGTWEPSCRQLRLAAHKMRRLAKPPKIAGWVFDLLAPDFNRERWEWANEASLIADYLFCTDGHTVGQLRQLGAKNVHVLRQGIPDDWEAPNCPVKPRDGVGDILWLGGAYSVREREIESLRGRFGDRVQHVNEGIRGRNLPALMASVKIVVGPAFPSRPGYWSNRIYVVLGNGGFFLAPSVLGMSDDGFQPGVHYAQYGPPTRLSCVDAVEHWLQQGDGARSMIARCGQHFVNNFHTYDHRVAEMIAMLR